MWWNRHKASYSPNDDLLAAHTCAIGANLYAHDYDDIGNHVLFSDNLATNTFTHNALNQMVGRDAPIAPPTTFAYTPDGGLSSDGTWEYAYDAEDQLLSVTSADLTNGAIRVLNAYDHRNRRIRKTLQQLHLSVAQPPALPVEIREWQTLETHTFVWDGNNIVLEKVDFADGTTRTFEYFWGMDKSGTEQGAGGVGGLLAVSIDGAFFIPCYDHNGNIVRYIAENGSDAAQYTYDPYGNVIEALGALAEQFPFGFSTKYHDRETGLVSYLMRFYNPPDGRWLNRDPIEEQGGENLYAFCRNNGVSNIDAYGLVTYYRCTAKAQTIIARAISNAIMVIPQVIDHIVSLEISESLSHHAVPQHVNAILQRKGLKPITLEEHVKLDGFTIIVLANLYRLENMLKGGNFGVECKCEKDSGCKSKAGPAEAYVAKGRLAKIISGRNINICPEFFNNSSKEQRGRIIHEASHWHSDINTDDYYAAPGEWELCAKDADFYDQLSKNQGLYFDFSIQYGIRRMREGGGK